MQTLSQLLNSTNSDSSEKKGRVEPRIWTPPLRELTPETSFGFDFIEFCEAIDWPLDPWQKWVAIHLGELNTDGTPRFRFALILVSRQNGKTLLCRLLILYWMFIEQHEVIIGTSTKRETAKYSWRKVIKMAESNDLLKQEIPPIHTRETIGEESFFTNDGSSYMFAAPNRNAGRSYTVNRALLDELRDHKNQDTYDGLINAGNAVSDFQAVAITNQGDATSIVLEDLRSAAIEFIETGNGNSTTFLAEWSAPQGCDPTDVNALAMANPNLNVRIPLVALMGQAIESKNKGGEKLARFRTENLCQKVHLLDPAIEPELWDKCGTNDRINMSEYRRHVVLCLDIALGGEHATLMAGIEVDGRYHLEVVKTWSGFGCTKQVRADLAEVTGKISARAIGWFPGGPAAAIAADLKAKPSFNNPWPPRNVKIIELNSEDVPSICMGFSDIVHAEQCYHPKDDLLTGQIKQTQKLKRGDKWVFTRAGTTSVEATYSSAGVIHLLRTLPPPLGPVSSGREIEK